MHNGCPAVLLTSCNSSSCLACIDSTASANYICTCLCCICSQWSLQPVFFSLIHISTDSFYALDLDQLYLSNFIYQQPCCCMGRFCHPVVWALQYIRTRLCKTKRASCQLQSAPAAQPDMAVKNVATGVVSTNVTKLLCCCCRMWPNSQQHVRGMWAQSLAAWTKPSP